MPNIYTIADSEGNAEHFREAMRLINKKRAGSKCKLVYLGDATDKSHGESVIYDVLLKHSTDIDIVLIAGNRESNKIRYLTELLSPKATANLMSENLPPYWSKGNLPLKYYREYLLETKYSGVQALSDEALSELYAEQTVTEKSWIHLEFIHKKTMGAADRSMFRAKELWPNSEEKAFKPTNKQIIVDSFIADMVTEEEYELLLSKGMVKTVKDIFVQLNFKIGRTRTYLECSKLLHLENGTLFCHSGVFADSYPHLQSGDTVTRCEEGSSFSSEEKIKAWINARNEEHKQLITSAITQVFSCISSGQAFGGMPTIATPAYDISLPNVPHALQSNDYTKDNPAALTPVQAALFNEAGVWNIVFGHQPTCSPTPMILKIDGITHCATDTSMITGEQDGRGHSAAVTVVGEDGKLVTIGTFNHNLRNKVNGEEYFIGAATDELIGLEIKIKGHNYRVNARLAPGLDNNALGNYVLVCQERKNSPFLSVDTEYGTITTSPEFLHKHLANDYISIKTVLSNKANSLADNLKTLVKTFTSNVDDLYKTKKLITETDARALLNETYKLLNGIMDPHDYNIFVSEKCTMSSSPALQKLGVNMLAICALAIALAIVIAPPVGIAVAAVGGLAAVGVFAYQHNKVSQMKQMAIDIFNTTKSC